MSDEQLRERWIVVTGASREVAFPSDPRKWTEPIEGEIVHFVEKPRPKPREIWLYSNSLGQTFWFEEKQTHPGLSGEFHVIDKLAYDEQKKEIEALMRNECGCLDDLAAAEAELAAAKAELTGAEERLAEYMIDWQKANARIKELETKLTDCNKIINDMHRAELVVNTLNDHLKSVVHNFELSHEESNARVKELSGTVDRLNVMAIERGQREQKFKTTLEKIANRSYDKGYNLAKIASEALDER